MILESGPESTAERGTRRQRAYHRSKVFQPAALKRGGAPVRVHILDVSVGGARLHCTTRVSRHEQVELVAEALSTRAHVVWARGDRVGLCFDRLLSDPELQQLLG